MKKLMLKEKSIVALTRGRVWRTVAGLEILDGREEESTCSCGPEREPWSEGLHQGQAPSLISQLYRNVSEGHMGKQVT